MHEPRALRCRAFVSNAEARICCSGGLRSSTLSCSLPAREEFRSCRRLRPGSSQLRKRSVASTELYVSSGRGRSLYVLDSVKGAWPRKTNLRGFTLRSHLGTWPNGAGGRSDIEGKAPKAFGASKWSPWAARDIDGKAERSKCPGGHESMWATSEFQPLRPQRSTVLESEIR